MCTSFYEFNTSHQVQPSESSGSISRRGRSFSINPSSTVSSYKPPTQTAKRVLSSELTQQPTPTPSPTQSLNAVRTQPPAPSPPLSRPSQGTGPQPPIHFSRTPQGGSLSLAPSTHIPRAVQTSLYKRAQSVGTTSYAVAETARLRLIERATKARLYLLHQIGPNRFLIGGDSLDSRFHVTIGSQVMICWSDYILHYFLCLCLLSKMPHGGVVKLLTMVWAVPPSPESITLPPGSEIFAPLESQYLNP